MIDQRARRREIGQARQERTRARLLTAAARILAELGSERARIDDIIQAADVARGTFYNYYTTQEELFDDLWRRIGRDPFAKIRDIAAMGEDPAHRLSIVTRLVLRRAADDQTWGWLVYALSATAETVNSDLLAYPRPDLIAGLQSGRFTFSSLEAAGDLIVGSTRARMRSILQAPATPAEGEALAQMHLMALGLRAREARDIAYAALPDVVAPSVASIDLG